MTIWSHCQTKPPEPYFVGYPLLSLPAHNVRLCGMHCCCRSYTRTAAPQSCPFSFRFLSFPVPFAWSHKPLVAAFCARLRIRQAWPSWDSDSPARLDTSLLTTPANPLTNILTAVSLCCNSINSSLQVIMISKKLHPGKARAQTRAGLPASTLPGLERWQSLISNEVPHSANVAWRRALREEARSGIEITCPGAIVLSCLV